ncbi:MAG: glycosyl hydrolase [Bacteroidota bacterium]
MKLTFCISIFTLAFVSLYGQPTFDPKDNPTPSGKKWEKVDALSDEFEGNTIDQKKWQLQPTENGWNWIGRAPGLFKAENVKVEDGQMKVTVGILDETQIIRKDTFMYQGAIVRSFQSGGPGYYYECRMKANATEMSSTFWLMSRHDCHKKQELDIQECVGVTSELTSDWASEWDQIFHSNVIHRPTECVEKTQLQKSIKPDAKNHERFYVYGCWWKSPEEILFFLDGKYTYTIHPKMPWDQPAWIQIAIETYDWNPVPEDGGMVKKGNLEERTTAYDWIRVWELR